MSLRLGSILICLILTGHSTAAASSCARLRSHPDRWVATSVDALVSTARRAYERENSLTAYQTVLARIANTIQQCRLDEDEVFARRYLRFLEYVDTVSLDLQPDHQLGFTVPDESYFAETRDFVQIPELLLDQNFLRLVSRFETLNKAKNFLTTLNSSRAPDDQLIFFSYTSRHLGTPDNDNSFIRLLIVVPGNTADSRPEKWVQFGITDPGARVRIRNVSVVAALPRPDGTVSVYFKDFFRTYRRDGIIRIKGRWELGHGDDNCLQCHKSGVLPIFPERDSVPADEQKTVVAVNQRLLGYGPARFGKYLDAIKLGPGLGTASAHDREQRFGFAFAGSVVGRAMTCAACHHQERMGALNWPMDRVLISSYIKGGEMPLGHNLQPAERSALHHKLIQEYFATDVDRPGILKTWLLSAPTVRQD